MMKRNLCFFFLFFLFLFNASARLGENPEELTKRLGTPIMETLVDGHGDRIYHAWGLGRITYSFSDHIVKKISISPETHLSHELVEAWGKKLSKAKNLKTGKFNRIHDNEIYLVNSGKNTPPVEIYYDGNVLIIASGDTLPQINRKRNKEGCINSSKL